MLSSGVTQCEVHSLSLHPPDNIGIQCCGLSSLLPSTGSLGIGLCNTAYVTDGPGHTWVGAWTEIWCWCLSFCQSLWWPGPCLLHPPPLSPPRLGCLLALALLVLLSCHTGEAWIYGWPPNCAQVSLLKHTSHPFSPTPSTLDSSSTRRGHLLSHFQTGSGAETSPTFSLLPNHQGCPLVWGPGNGDIAGCCSESSSSR